MFDQAVFPPDTKVAPYFLQLRNIPQNIAGLENKLAGIAPIGSAMLLGQDISFSWSPSPMTPQTPCQIIQVTSGDQDLRICIPRDLIPHLMGDAAVSQMPPDLSAKTAALVLEHLLTSFLEPLERRLDGPVHITSVSNGYLGLVAFSAFRFQLSCDGLTAPTTVCLQAPDPDWVLGYIKSLGAQSKTAMPDIEVDLQFLAHEFELTRYDLSSLVAGDCLVLDGDWDVTQKIQMIAGRTLTAPIYQGRSGFKIRDPLKTIPMLIPQTSHSKETPMDLKDRDDTFNHIAITVSIEIESRTVPMSELRKYNTGSIIPLETTMPEMVRLLANNKPFATAELVKVGDKVAVQISELL